jgi:hypothetical protein
MQDVPKIVVKRLQETAARDLHPDADLLTAFVEQSLAGSERAGVFEHLARCSDCREIIAFALPASEAVTPVPSSSNAGRGWLSWPVLRWGVVAAGLLLVTSVGVLQYRQGQSKNKVANSTLKAQNEAPANSAPDLASPANAEPKAVPSQMQKKRQVEAGKKTTRNTRRELDADRSVNLPNGTLATDAAGSAGSGGGIGGGVWRAQPTRPSARTVTPAPAPESKDATMAGSQMSDAQSESVATARNQASDQLIQNQTEQSSPNLPYTSSDVVKAKPPVPSPAASNRAPSPAAPDASAQTTTALVVQASPRWTISSAGALQRSFDGGETWEDVSVNATLLARPSQMASVAANKREKNVKKEQSQLQPVFRAVASSGSNVWAGGSDAMLYHSADSGAHWSRVLPSSAVAVLAGDIIRIELSDMQHCGVATSTGELWITTDNGQTWQRKQ